jgi:glycosyltransferase involved in cell wall biosynthesis
VPPRIVVVIPCRDDADYLDACLSALDRQTRRPDEVIVVDNASTDATADVARAHGATLLREERVGIWPAAARGYDDAAASADIIARVDADSRPHPDWVARLERAFAEDEALGVLTGGAEFYDCSRLVAYLGSHWYIGGGRVWIGLWLGIPLVFGSNFAMRVAVWERVRDRVRRADPHVHDDLDLTIHLHADDGVRWDRTLTMPVSARPLVHVGGLLRRVWRVVETFAASWPDGRFRAARRHVSSLVDPLSSPYADPPGEPAAGSHPA